MISRLSNKHCACGPHLDFLRRLRRADDLRSRNDALGRTRFGYWILRFEGWNTQTLLRFSISCFGVQYSGSCLTLIEDWLGDLNSYSLSEVIITLLHHCRRWDYLGSPFHLQNREYLGSPFTVWSETSLFSYFGFENETPQFLLHFLRWDSLNFSIQSL